MADTPQTPYQQLQTAIAEYGDAAMENFLRCRAFALAVHDGLPTFMGCGEDCVSMVPAQGEFDPTREYGDRAFSFDPRGVIRLEPIVFGLCVIVPNAEDSGSLWLRTGIRAEITGDTFDVFVSHQPMVRVALDYDGQLTPVFETIQREFLSVFKKELAHFHDQRYAGGIGFIPPQGKD